MMNRNMMKIISLFAIVVFHMNIDFEPLLQNKLDEKINNIPLDMSGALNLKTENSDGTYKYIKKITLSYLNENSEYLFQNLTPK